MKSVFTLCAIIFSTQILADTACSTNGGFASTIEKNKEKIATKYLTTRMKVEEQLINEVKVISMNEGDRIISKLVKNVRAANTDCPELKHSGRARLEVMYMKRSGEHCTVTLGLDGTVPVWVNNQNDNQFSLSVKPVSLISCK